MYMTRVFCRLASLAVYVFKIFWRRIIGLPHRECAFGTICHVWYKQA